MAWGSGTLQQGSQGPDVQKLQQFLNQHGAHLAVDGDFGPATAAAVKAFQQSQGITADGVVGPQTWGKITGAPAPTSGGKPAPSSAAGDKSLEDYINQHYPGMAPLMSNPEIKAGLLQAAKEQWSPEKLQAWFYGTQYWKSHNQTQEKWPTLSTAEQITEIDSTLTKMSNDLLTLFGTQAFNKQWGSVDGFKQRDRNIAYKIASGAMTYEDWLLGATVKARQTNGTQAFADEMQRQQQLAQQLKTPQEVAEQLFEKAHGDYFVNLSKQDAVTWANNIINGKSSYGEFDDYLRGQAATLYPFYKDSISNGVLPKALFGPALNTLSSELETSTEGVIANPKLWGEITAQAAGTKGQFTAADWVTYARSLPEWKKTQGAAQMAGDFSDKLLREFGAVA